MTDFTFEQAMLALSTEGSDEGFIFDFDDCWQWCGYSRKDAGLRSLISICDEGVDFVKNESTQFHPISEGQDDGFSLRPRDKYLLSKDGFKAFAAGSHTEKGKQVRRYLIAAEKQLRALQASAKKVELLSPWKPARELTKHGHNDFVNAYIRKRHPGGAVHDLITRLITGYTAAEARELPNVDGDSNIGLNHQPSPEQLEQIAEAKRIYCGLKKGTWKEQCYRAVWQACPEDGDDV